jgi:hypothetical protein
MARSEDVTELLEDLNDARAELDRYRSMLRNLNGGAGLGLAMAIVAVSPIVPASVRVVLLISGILLGLACTIGFIVRICTANTKERNYETLEFYSVHPAVKVRAAERAYNRAILRDS